jgi:hypothetical protein
VSDTWWEETGLVGLRGYRRSGRGLGSSFCSQYARGSRSQSVSTEYSKTLTGGTSINKSYRGLQGPKLDLSAGVRIKQGWRAAVGGKVNDWCISSHPIVLCIVGAGGCKWWHHGPCTIHIGYEQPRTHCLSSTCSPLLRTSICIPGISFWQTSVH